MTTFGRTLRRGCALTVALGTALQGAPSRAQTATPTEPADTPPRNISSSAARGKLDRRSQG